MDWANESYVRVYRRKTTTARLLGWEGNAVLRMVVTELDRGGYLELDGLSPVEAVTLHTDMPEDVVHAGLSRLLKRGVLIVVGDRLLMPNYVEAQTTSKSEVQRKREQRERDAAERAELEARAAVTKRDAKVTDGDGESRTVTNSHGMSGPVPPPSRKVTLSLNPVLDPVPDHDPDLGPEQISPPDGGSPVVRSVFDHWVKVHGKASTTKLTPQRKGKVNSRLREGYTAQQLCAAVDGCKRSAFHMGENDRGQPYNDLETILKSGKTVEEHIARLAAPALPIGARPANDRGPAPVSATFDESENPDWARGNHG